jgi:hypothetical protein
MKNIVVFYDANFPYEGERPDEAAMEHLRSTYSVIGAAELAEALAQPQTDVFVHLHGAYFPKDAWTAVLRHVKQGKGLLHMGGAPFRIPVYQEQGQWQEEPSQTGYHQQLHIHEALPVDPTPIRRLRANEDIPLFTKHTELFSIEPTYGLVLHVTRVDDSPGELGSSGPMDAHIYPLLLGVTEGLRHQQREVAAPAVLIEHTKGDFAGGRWVLINQTVRERFWTQGGLTALQEWASFVASGVTEMWIKPNYGSYEPGERATFTIQLQRIINASRIERSDLESKWSCTIHLLKAKESAASVVDPSFSYSSDLFTMHWSSQLSLRSGREIGFFRIAVPVTLEPGFYAAECTMVSANGERRTLRQGFWGLDRDFLSKGEMISVDRDYFQKDNRPLPIVGMTYMTSDVARKFLFMPNVAIWDRDMAQMKRAGINMIRTGIWTAWRQMMFVDGHPNEEVLRAIDAFLLTAKRYDLEVTFNFFSFTPEMWDGVNPYLDPRSVEAQKRFIAAVVSRHANTAHVHWDLINEPSMFDPKRIFKQGARSCHDRFEQEAFVTWLRERHCTIRLLQERWNMTPDELPSFEAVRLPEPGDISLNTTESLPKKGGPWLDYTLFSMDMHNRWASQLIDTIRSIQPKQLVTVGQDEGLGAQRPSPFFYAEEVDYTTVHTWWKMDDLVWDGIFTKTIHKPNVIQETGIMYVETPNGRAKRSEEELRNILERKYAYSFSTGGAGAVQWIWNINFYMNNINESNIGALRADGTEKPEANVSYHFGSFMESIRDLFVDRELEEVAVVFPYSNDFSNRKLANEATTRMIRTLSYQMNVHARGLGEYHLDSLAVAPPKLIILPSPHNFSDEALERLLSFVSEQEGILLITGPIGLDAYWRPTARLASETGAGAITNVLREELLQIGEQLIPVSFGGAHIADANKQIPKNSGEEDRVRGRRQPVKLHDVPLGKGRLLWCPLPVELSERIEPLEALYQFALKQAGVKQELEWLEGGNLPGIYGRKQTFRDGALYTFVSEFGLDTTITVRDPETGKEYAFILESERSVLFAADRAGRVIAVYRPDEVEVTVRG